MRHRLAAAALCATALSATPAFAQPIQYQSADGINNTPVSAASPLPITGTISATTAGTATAAAPTYIEGVTTAPLSFDLAGNLRTKAVQSGTWNVGLTGTLPAFASTPAFTISGTLPAFAAAPTVIAQQSGISVTVTPTVQNAAYASGNAMGTLQTLFLGTAASVLTDVCLASKGGDVVAKTVLLFYANPAASTFTDKSAITLSSTDVPKMLGPPLSITPAAITGATQTQACASNLGLPVPSGGAVYAEIVATAADTPATTSDLLLTAGAF